jgi:antitoxin ParD1/3/4
MISADLGQQLENFVTSLVATGRYNSKSEVLREGVRLIHDRETRLAALDVVFNRLEAKYRAMSTGGE